MSHPRAPCGGRLPAGVRLPHPDRCPTREGRGGVTREHCHPRARRRCRGFPADARACTRSADGNRPIGISWVLDGYGNLMLLVVAVVSFASTLYSVRYMERYTAAHRYYSLFLLMVTGMNGVIITGDLFNLFVFLEIASIASYALVAFGCEQDELEASFKYLVLGSIGSTLVLLGIAFVYGATGYLNMASISTGARRARRRAPCSPWRSSSSSSVSGSRRPSCPSIPGCRTPIPRPRRPSRPCSRASSSRRWGSMPSPACCST